VDLNTAKIMKSPFGDPVNSMGPPVWVGNSPPPLPNSQDFFWVCNSTNLFLSSCKQTVTLLFFCFRKDQNTNDTFINEPTKRNGHHNHRLVRSRNEPLSEEVCKTNRYNLFDGGSKNVVFNISTVFVWHVKDIGSKSMTHEISTDKKCASFTAQNIDRCAITLV
jgi:hypothetical protein